MVVVVDELGDGEFDLYVDTNRNRIIEARDLVSGTGPTRRAELPARITRDDISQELPRTVLFRRGTLPKTLGFATCGYLEGTLEFDGRTFAARRVDGDGNGFFADTRDRLWIDRNADGRWDPFGEQFPFRSVLQLDGRRYALRSDEFGLTLETRELAGSGALRLRLATLVEDVRLQDLEVMLLGEDGSAVSVRQHDQPVDVPVGRYALGTVRLSVADASGKPWSYVFSRSGTPSEEQWHDVGADQQIVVDPIGELRFVLHGSQWEGAVLPGESLEVHPRLYTSDGLSLNNCVPGRQERFSRNTHSAQLRLVRDPEQTLATATSGFA